MTDSATDKSIEHCMDIIVGARLARLPQVVFHFYRDRNEWQASALDCDGSVKRLEVCYEGNFICGYGSTPEAAARDFKTNLLRAFNEIYGD